LGRALWHGVYHLQKPLGILGSDALTATGWCPWQAACFGSTGLGKDSIEGGFLKWGYYSNTTKSIQIIHFNDFK